MRCTYLQLCVKELSFYLFQLNQVSGILTGIYLQQIFFVFESKLEEINLYTFLQHSPLFLLQNLMKR